MILLLTEFTYYRAFNIRFERPVLLLQSPIDKNRFYVIEQGGRIKTFLRNSEKIAVALDLSDRVKYGGEMGLLSMAFDPDFENNGYVYVYYYNKRDFTVLSRFKSYDGVRFSKNTEKVIFKVKQPFKNHNGGHLEFGPDGYLYLSLGDGGSAGDPLNNAQNPNSPLGKILRFNVKTFSYEIFAYGLRNPWRFSFDSLGRMWVGDVGQNRWEEINLVEKGKNYGWRCYEGFEEYNIKSCKSKKYYEFPIYTYRNDGKNCSVIGGYFYMGIYIFGDYCSGKVWGLKPGEKIEVNLLFDTDFNISSFSRDIDGNIYIIDHKGGYIYRIKR